MFAVAKEDAIEFVRFQGLFMEPYPEWFLTLVDMGVIYEEDGRACYSSDDGSYDMVRGDVILHNPRTGLSRFIEMQKFNDYFYEVL